MESPEYEDLLVPKSNKSGLLLKDPKKIPNYGEFVSINIRKSDFPKVTLERINLGLLGKKKSKSSRAKEKDTLTSGSQMTVLLKKTDKILLSNDSSINSPISSKKHAFLSERPSSSKEKTITPISSSASSRKLCLSSDSVDSQASTTNDSKVLDEKLSPLILRTKTKLPDGILNTENLVNSIQYLNLKPTVRVERITESFIKSFSKQKTQETDHRSKDRSRSRTKKRRSKHNTKSPLRSVSVSRKELNERSNSCKAESRANSKSSSNNKLKQRSKSESRARTRSKSPARSRPQVENESTDLSDYEKKSEVITSLKSNQKSSDRNKKSKSKSVNLRTSSSSNESRKRQKLRDSPSTTFAKSPGTSGKFEKHTEVSLIKFASAHSLETSNENSSKTDKNSNLETEALITNPNIAMKGNHSHDKNSKESRHKRNNLGGKKKKPISCEVPKNYTVVENKPKGAKPQRSFKTRVVTNGKSRNNTLKPDEANLEACKGEKMVMSNKMEEMKICEMKEVFERAGYNLKDVCRRLDLKAFKEGLKKNPSKRIYVGLTKSLEENHA